MSIVLAKGNFLIFGKAKIQRETLFENYDTK